MYCLKSAIFSLSPAIVSVISAFVFVFDDSFSFKMSCAFEVISFSCGSQYSSIPVVTSYFRNKVICYPLADTPGFTPVVKPEKIGSRGDTIPGENN